MAPTHGPLFDEFPAQPGDPHGPHQDEGYRPSGTANAGGSLDSLSPTYRENTADPMWDNRTWHTPMHAHGARLDEDFAQPAALDGDGREHGTWFDVFRGGRPIKAIVDGIDVECVVLECKADHVVAEVARGKNQGGGRVELALSQITGLAAATEQGSPGRPIKTATPGNTPAPQKASNADAPSAHSTEASGGHLRQTHKSLDDVLVDLRKIAE